MNESVDKLNEIVDNVISIFKGNDMDIEIKITYIDGEEYVIDPEDKIVFTVKKDIKSEEIMIEKEFTSFDDTSYTIHLDPEDTINFTNGKYKYDVKLFTYDGFQYTIIGPTIFRILGVINDDITM